MPPNVAAADGQGMGHHGDVNEEPRATMPDPEPSPAAAAPETPAAPAEPAEAPTQADAGSTEAQPGSREATDAWAAAILATPGSAATPPQGDDVAPAAGPDTPATDAPAPGADAPAAPSDLAGMSPEPPAPPRGGAGRSVVRALVGILVLGLVFGAGFGTGRVTAPSSSAAPSGEAVVPDESEPVDSEAPATPVVSPLEEDGPLLGSPDAKVVMDYWADYQCPYCARFGLDILPLLESRVRDGTLAIRHRDFTFIGTESLWVAVAVRCAGDEDSYWPMHAAVYAAQDGENQGAFARTNLVEIAASVLGDTTGFEACLADHQKLVDVLDDTSAGNRAGVKSTPTLDVNGQRFEGVPDANRLIAAIDAAAAGAAPAVLPTPAPSAEPWTDIVTSGREAGVVGAPVTVELWMDYQAPESGPVVNDLEPELRTRIADGRVRLVLRDFAALGDESVSASVFVRCTAGLSDHAWFISDILAVSAKGAGAGIFVTDNFLNVAARLGMPIRQLDTCMADDTVAQKVRDETSQGREVGIMAGPTVVVLVQGREVARFSGGIAPSAVLDEIDRH